MRITQKSEFNEILQNALISFRVQQVITLYILNSLNCVLKKKSGINSRGSIIFVMDGSFVVFFR